MHDEVIAKKADFVVVTFGGHFNAILQRVKKKCKHLV
jgi:hypothetical protein